MARIDKSVLDALRDFISKTNRTFSQQKGFYQAAPVKTEMPEVQDPPPQITGSRDKRTSDIPGDKAGGDKIGGGYEAGGKSPVA